MSVKAFSSVLIFLITASLGYAQKFGFDFGKILYEELDMKEYSRDTAASAVVLKETGDVYFSNSNGNMVFEYHTKIKILKKKGLSQGDFLIVLRKQTESDLLLELKASTFNKDGQTWKESKFDPKTKFVENYSKYADLVKFALPDVRVGSVIEVMYKVESPFFQTLKDWSFQSDIPKVSSYFRVKIPGTYEYFITLRGFLNLSKNTSSLVQGCFNPGDRGVSADCVLNEYGMQNIPAFVDEDFMTAKKNFMSAIYFELKQINHFDGTVEKLTKEWKDVDKELKEYADFGDQIKKAKSIFKDELPKIVGKETDEKRKANLIYENVKGIKWNQYWGKYALNGVKKAFADKSGNIGDINLFLTGALQAAGFDANPVILSTRENGLVTELHPVITDFNYVICHAKIDNQEFLLDATDPFLPLGILPNHCLNGKGRLLGKESRWIELKATEKAKTNYSLDLTLNSEGVFLGKMSVQSSGYDGFRKRKKFSAGGQDQYISDLSSKWGGIEISNFELTGVKDLDKPFNEKFDVKIQGVDNLEVKTLFLDPFFVKTLNANPLKSNARFFPVDLGVPSEQVYSLTLQLPDGFIVEEMPSSTGMRLPNEGGKYLMNVSNYGNKLTISYVIQLDKAIYGPEEYSSLKEFYARVISSQQNQIVLKRIR